MKKLLLSLLAAACTTSAQASSFKTLYSFTGNDGAFPSASLTVVGDQLYGTTEAGGAYTSGVVFSFAPATNTYTIVHNFTGGDGAEPEGTLLLGKDGTLYGITMQGGAVGGGTVYAVANGKEKVVHSFGNGYDGYYTEGNLIEIGGKLYGVATSGGANGTGAVFAVTPAGKEEIVYSFGVFEGGGGFFPFAGLTKFNGALYGIAASGGSNCGNTGCGIVYSVTPGGSESVVYNFGETSTDAAFPYGVLARNGKSLYGTTYEGGTYGRGTVYSVNVDGSETVIYSFGATGNDGTGPYGGVIKVGGKFYGTTYAGGKNGLGTVYSLTPDGHEKVLHSFAGGKGGSQPVADLVEYNGVLYGTAQNGGYGYTGTIFSVTP
jgi:uncharacterized repeat protein (TIGR03803 family)